MEKNEELIFARNEEYDKRVDIIIKLGRKIMECLEPRHRYLFLEYERQVNLKNLFFDKF